MTNSQRRALAAYVREALDMFGLVRWKLILLVNRPPGEGTDDEFDGFCDCVYGMATARMWFSEDLLTHTPGRARHVVTHEITHIFFDRAWQAFTEPLRYDGHLPMATFSVLTRAAHPTWEHAVDSVARALAPRLPYIDWDANPSPDWVPALADEDVPVELIVSSRMWGESGHETV